MSGKYVLNDQGEPELCDDVVAWSYWFETADRVVKQDDFGGVMVSTVFLGLDHSFGEGPPVLYETLVFGGKLDDEQERYSTRKEAEQGHERMVSRLKQRYIDLKERKQ